MHEGSQPVSRRGLFRALLRPLSQHLESIEEEASPEGGGDSEVSQLAVIQGRFCLAYQGGLCFTCSERCPVPGAITTKRGIPTVHVDICTGCGICHDLCPAPRNAILMVNKKEPDEEP
jgi:Na+-translocating ferredoxin:NAD+ oxidoreductase RNF subunit RnfB